MRALAIVTLDLSSAMLPDPRFDESRDRTDPKRARAMGLANASAAGSGARARRLEGRARADRGMLDRKGLPFHPQAIARVLAAYDARAAFDVAAKACGLGAL